MPVLKTSVDPGSEEFAANLEVQSAAVSALERESAIAIAGGGEKYIQRHRDRGRLVASPAVAPPLRPAVLLLERLRLLARLPAAAHGCVSAADVARRRVVHG